MPTSCRASVIVRTTWQVTELVTHIISMSEPAGPVVQVGDAAVLVTLARVGQESTHVFEQGPLTHVVVPVLVLNLESQGVGVGAEGVWLVPGGAAGCSTAAHPWDGLCALGEPLAVCSTSWHAAVRCDGMAKYGRAGSSAILAAHGRRPQWARARAAAGWPTHGDPALTLVADAVAVALGGLGTICRVECAGGGVCAAAAKQLSARGQESSLCQA